MSRFFSVHGVVLAAGLLAGGVVVAAQEPGHEDERTSDAVPPTTGMGAICWAAIVETGYQVASRCDLGEQSASRETIRAYEKARTDLASRFLAHGWNQEMLDKFRAQQGRADTPTELLCGFDRENDTGLFLLSLAQGTPDIIHKTTQSVLAIPGEPKWGTCL